jgi:hypothetical protein
MHLLDLSSCSEHLGSQHFMSSSCVDQGSQLFCKLMTDVGEEANAENATASSPPPTIGPSTLPEVRPSRPTMSKEESDDAKKAILNKSKSTPAPGQYRWNDDIHLRKRPVWSMFSPDRAHLDLMLGTWTPASTSLQPRAPDPGEYGDQSIVGRNGLFTQPKWSWEKSSIRPCLLPDPPKTLESAVKLQPTVGGKQATRRSYPTWSVYGKDRSSLPFDIPTWTPKMTTDLRPGPGQYDLDRVGRKWKASTRRGCTFGGKPANLHPMERDWVPQTFGCRLLGGEGSRMRQKKVPPTRCSCVACPGPGHCSDHLS